MNIAFGGDDLGQSAPETEKLMTTTKTPEPGIYKRGPKQYQVKIRRNGVSVNRTFETMADARRWRSVQVGKIVAHEFVDKSKERRTLLATVLEEYLVRVTPKKKGRRQEENRIKAWMRTDLANYPIGGIERSDIAEWIESRMADGKAPSTVCNEINLLSAVFKKAADWGFRIENPCREVERPKQRPARFATLDADEKAKLLKACARGPKWLPYVVRLALTTGMRQGEIRRLNWGHIHGTWLHLPETKNGETRDVPLTREAEQVIEDIKRDLPRRLDGWVFGDPDRLSADGGFTEWQVQQAYRDAAIWAEEHLGLERRTFHDLRHVALTALAAYHDNVLTLQRTSGHKTVAVLSRYINLKPEDAARMVRDREAAHKASA